MIGLINLDVLLVADNLLLIPIFLALYVALRRSSESLVTLGATAGLLAIPLFISSIPAFEMLSLSDRVRRRNDRCGALRPPSSRAGDDRLVAGHGFPGAYLLSSIGGLIIAVVMLRARVFNKATAFVGLLTNGIGLGIFVPTIGLFLAVLSIRPLGIWYVLLSYRLFQLGRPEASGGSAVKPMQAAA